MAIRDLIFSKKPEYRTLYNVDLDVRPNSSGMPKLVYNRSVVCFKNAGLLGEKHVLENGLLVDGFDPKCDVMQEGKFRIFYRQDNGESIRDIVQRAKLRTSGFNDAMQEVIKHGEYAVDELERIDPLSTLPWNTYMQMPYIESMELVTPAGIQTMHAHTKDDLIRFWKPNKEDVRYDLSTLKYYLFNQAVSGWDRSFMTSILNAGKRRKAHNLWEKLWDDPASVDTVEF